MGEYELLIYAYVGIKETHDGRQLLLSNGFIENGNPNYTYSTSVKAEKIGKLYNMFLTLSNKLI